MNTDFYSQMRHAKTCRTYLQDATHIIIDVQLGDADFYTKFRTKKGRIITIKTSKNTQVVKRNGVIVSISAGKKRLPARNDVENQKH